MGFRVELAEQASRDINEAYAWLSERSPDAALRWYEELCAAIAGLREMPTRCPLARESYAFTFELRQLVFGRYRVLFSVAEDLVHVRHVRHHARRDADGSASR